MRGGFKMPVHGRRPLQQLDETGAANIDHHRQTDR